ncbi:MAG: hypothetical protein KDI13_04695 [Alphaproteobacteria bacterium]|nr:hypothetical protein [Alphaproteobacteria bacterium]
MEDVQGRLQETSQNCLQAYSVWKGKRTDTVAREALLAAIHELRKVASRLEIDLAISERNDMGSRPLPIPSHRAALDNDIEDDDEGHGNVQPGAAPQPGAGGGGDKPRTARRRRTPPSGKDA